MTDDVVIQVNNVSKKFKSQVVLKDITLQCRKGRIYGFVGYNGSGKTVLFKCICGLLYVDEGEIRVNGEKIGHEMIKNAGIIIEGATILIASEIYPFFTSASAPAHRSSGGSPPRSAP